MCYMYPKTRSIFTRTLCDSDQKLKVMSFKEAIYHPVVFQVLGIIFSSQDNFQTNYMFLSHISGRLHWICMKSVLCWQKFLWNFIFWTCFHLGECFSPLHQCVTLFLLILTEHTLTDLCPTFLAEDVNITFNLHYYLHCPYKAFWKMQWGLTALKFRAVSSEIQVQIVQVQIIQVWMVPHFKNSFSAGL